MCTVEGSKLHTGLRTIGFDEGASTGPETAFFLGPMSAKLLKSRNCESEDLTDYTTKNLNPTTSHIRQEIQIYGGGR